MNYQCPLRVEMLTVLCCQALALIIGAAYYNLQLTSQGAFTRGSVIFAGLLTCALDTFGEVRALFTVGSALGALILSRRCRCKCLVGPSSTNRCVNPTAEFTSLV